MKDLYLFDLDGTLADCQHRVHFLNNTDDPNRWRKFYAACGQDKPIQHVIEVMNSLLYARNDVWVVSGRSDECREQTEAWLTNHSAFFGYMGSCHVIMRRAGDTRPDNEVKQEMLDNMLVDDRERIAAVFDDRDRVVAMWRSNGIPCYQVAPGNF